MSRAIRIVQFTLIELMIIIAVILILASLLMPMLSESRIKAKLTACQGNLKALGAAAGSYQNDNGGCVVVGWDATVADAAARTQWPKLKRYYGDDRTLMCPSNPLDKLECYGLFAALSGRKLADTVPNPAGTVLMGENTQLDYESYTRPIEEWERASSGHWELGYATSFTNNDYTTQWTARRPINPFVHRPLVNLIFCDGHLESMHYVQAWGGPYKYGDPGNIWDNK